MITMPNFVYDFTFKSVFSSLNGIYKVESANSYNELLNNQIDLYNLTYKKYNATDESYKNDLEAIKNGKTYKLVHVTSGLVLYIPEILFDDVPNGDVHKYLRLGLAVDIGIFENINNVSTVKNEVDNRVSLMTGTENKTIVYSVRDEWMTKDEYELINSTRNGNITQITNLFTQNQDLLKQINSLQTKINNYEALLISLQ